MVHTIYIMVIEVLHEWQETIYNNLWSDWLHIWWPIRLSVHSIHPMGCPWVGMFRCFFFRNSDLCSASAIMLIKQKPLILLCATIAPNSVTHIIIYIISFWFFYIFVVWHAMRLAHHVWWNFGVCHIFVMWHTKRVAYQDISMIRWWFPGN